LIDDNVQAGGQYFRQLPASYTTAGARLLRDKSRFDALSKVLSRPEVTYLPSTTVWGVPAPLTLAYAGDAGSGRIKGSSVVIATGAQDRPFPFSGWTLPGVITAGGCLNLAKAHGLVPSGKVIVVGNGPLVLVAAATLAAAGANLVGVVEAQQSRRLFGTVCRGLSAAPGLIKTAISYRARIQRSGAWFRTGWMVAEAQGSQRIERVAIAPVGEDGKPLRERMEWHDTDLLVSGYGIMPALECARLFGCRTVHDPSLQGDVPIRSETLETSVDQVYAVGDGAGIGGVEVALLEGRRAADAILGKSCSGTADRAYKRLDRFRRQLNLAYAPERALRAMRPETIVCRCEELTLHDLSLDPNLRHGDLDRLKKSSRLGMGRCQGRNCLPSVGQLFDLPPDRNAAPRVRPPIKPIPLRHLIADADVGPVREPDETLAQPRK
jgi:thioredoxin reductase